MFQTHFRSFLIRNGSVLKLLPFYINSFRTLSTNYNKNCNKIIANINFGKQIIEFKPKESTDSVETLKFPFIWLRDNCKCDKCYHATSSSRIINWEKFDVEAAKPKSIMYNDQNDTFQIIWSDDEEHVSEFSYDWLHERNFTKENREKYLAKYYRPEKFLLNKSNFLENLEYFDYQKVIENDLYLFRWLHSFITKGTAVICNVPKSENEVRFLANRVGFIRRTHYGEEFVVKAKKGTSNVAYLSENLQLHTDLPYYDYAPGSNLLQYFIQSESEGAQNLLTDGFYIAHKMRVEYPREFEILSKIPVNWSDIGQEDNNYFHSLYRAPMICLDFEGNISRINHSIPQRDSFFSVSLEECQSWYKAFTTFIKLIYDEAIEMKMNEGTILCFDNIRFIHGRRKYEDRNGNCRHVIGAYLDWDEIFSRYRVLQKKFENLKTIY